MLSIALLHPTNNLFYAINLTNNLFIYRIIIMEKRPKLPNITEVYKELFGMALDKFAAFALSRVSNPSRTNHQPEPPSTGSHDSSPSMGGHNQLAEQIEEARIKKHQSR